MEIVNEFLTRLFDAHVDMELRVCFTIAKYENDRLSLCETINVFVDAFCYSKIHFHQLGPFKLIKTVLEYSHGLLGLSPVWNRYLKGSH